MSDLDAERARAEAALSEASGEEVRARRLLSVGAVARELQVSLGTIRNWIKAGKLPAERTLGGRYRVRVGDMRAAQKAQKEQSAQS